MSLAEAQQELQMLQKQLGERSEHCCLGVPMRGGPHSAALHGFGWLGMKGKLGTGPRWQMEGKLARFLSEMRLLLSLGCVPSATGRIQTLSTWCSQTANRVRHNTVLWQSGSVHPWKSGKCLTAGRDKAVMLCPGRMAPCMDGFVGSLHILLQTALNDIESPISSAWDTKDDVEIQKQSGVEHPYGSSSFCTPKQETGHVDG